MSGPQQAGSRRSGGRATQAHVQARGLQPMLSGPFASRFLLDACVFDRLLEDPEAAEALFERRDLRLLVAPLVREQLAATPDPSRREALLSIARSLCSTVAAPPPDPARAPGDAADFAILAAARRAKATFVSDDRSLLDIAMREGDRVLDWRGFLNGVVYGPPRSSGRA